MIVRNQIFNASYQQVINPLNSESDQHLISPHSNVAVSFAEIMRIKEMITTQRSFGCTTNSPCQY